MTGKAAAAAQRRFIEDFASLLTSMGMSPTMGRVYGYILLEDARVSVDEIAEALDVSRVGAWKAARELEGTGHLRRYGEPGSKRALYGPADNFAAPLMRQSPLLAALSALLEHGAATLVSGAAAERLQDMSVFCRLVKQAIEDAIREVEASRSARGRVATRAPRSKRGA